MARTNQMTNGKQWWKIAMPGLHLLAALALLITGVTSAMAAPTAEEAAAQTSQQAEMKSMSIIPVEDGGPSVRGVAFTVTTEDGTLLGSCSVAIDFPENNIPNCSVSVPKNTIVKVWFDSAASTTDVVPVENPVYFDTSTEQNAQMWGPAFTFQAADGASSGGTGGPVSAPGGAPTFNALAILPAEYDIPVGLVETGRKPRDLSEAVAYYTDPAETTRLFTHWGWRQNVIASFAIPEDQYAQSGKINGIYISIHEFGSPEAARKALDYLLAEQADGTPLREVPTTQLGEYTRALYGPLDYGNESTLLTQYEGLVIRVSVAMLEGDPTAEAESVMEGIIERVTSTETDSFTGGESTTGTNSSESELFFPIGCGPAEACLNATVTVTTQNGQTISSCTMPDTPLVAPWVCTAQNVPRGIVVALTIDGIAPGYVAEENPVYWDTTNEPEMYGTIGIPGFSLIPANGSSSRAPHGEATLLMTFRGCPEGFDPNTGDFFVECTIPLDAPDNSFLYHGGDGQGGMNIAWLDRQSNGAYIFTAGPNTMNLELIALAPVLRDAYQVVGFDSTTGNTFTVNLVDGETREVFVFYYYL